MKLSRVLSFLILMVVSSHSWAYGSSSQSACKKPEFTEFNPTDKAEAAPGSAFSLVVSGIANPSSIEVTVKNQSLPVTTKQLTPNRYRVAGNLPVALTGQFVRINVSAESKCTGSDGWLIKITD